jgi:hypothetical protein
MDRDISAWIRRHRLLRVNKTPNTYGRKKEILLRLYDLAMSGADIPAKPYIYESHQADIRQMPDHGVILCDVHYWDIAMLVASSFYVAPTYDVRKLADALVVDSLLCHGNPLQALHYARKFIRNPYVAVFNSLEHREVITGTVQMQVLFALLHEKAHYIWNQPDHPLAMRLQEDLGKLIDSQNAVSQRINSLDLTPIKPYLDKIDKKSARTFPEPENAEQIVIAANEQIFDVIFRHGHLVDCPDVQEQEKLELLFYACDHYICGTRAQLLPREEMLEEGVCDLLALTELLDMGLEGFSGAECRMLAITGYILALTTQNMIHNAMNLDKYANGRGYAYVDTIYMRREKERLLLPLVLSAFNLLYDGPVSEEEEQVLGAYMDQVCAVSDAMYAKFCDYLFSIENTPGPFIPHGSEEWLALYREINSLMQYPV